MRLQRATLINSIIIGHDISAAVLLRLSRDCQEPRTRAPRDWVGRRRRRRWRWRCQCEYGYARSRWQERPPYLYTAISAMYRCAGSSWGFGSRLGGCGSATSAYRCCHRDSLQWQRRVAACRGAAAPAQPPLRPPPARARRPSRWVALVARGAARRAQLDLSARSTLASRSRATETAAATAAAVAAAAAAAAASAAKRPRPRPKGLFNLRRRLHCRRGGSGSSESFAAARRPDCRRDGRRSRRGSSQLEVRQTGPSTEFAGARPLLYLAARGSRLAQPFGSRHSCALKPKPKG